MNKNKLPGVFADIFFDTNYKKLFSKLKESHVKLPVTDSNLHMGRQSEKNDLKKTHAISYTLGTFSVDTNYIVIN